jgi:SAM-dependent MidA family methyltransferase
LARLVVRLDEALDRPSRLDVVDIGAGRGELLIGLLAALPEAVARRVSPTAVELAPRPSGLPDHVRWVAEPPAGVTGLVLATEWLDNVPVDIVEVDEHGTARYVTVDGTGEERLDGPVRADDADWLARWWPLSEPGTRAEIGTPRDVAWATAVSTVDRGAALTVDFGHFADARPPFGTLAGYRFGREASPVPDGSCDLTVAVALDAVAAAVPGAPPTLIRQRAALHALGIERGRPPLALATADPGEYVRALSRSTAAAELTDPAGLGGHWWVVQWV